MNCIIPIAFIIILTYKLYAANEREAECAIIYTILYTINSDTNHIQWE